MRLAAGTIVSLVLTFGTLSVIVLVAVDSSDNIISNGRRPPKNSRFLYNYSKNSNSNNNNSNTGYGGNYGGAYGASSNYMNPNYANGDGTYGGSYGGGTSSPQQYGNNYANYEDNGYNNNQNYDNQNYDNSYYIWQNDDMDDAYKNDDGSYYNSNSNYQADGSNYNGRDQSWGGAAVQAYTDDEVPTVYEEGIDEDDEEWNIFGKINGLTAKETVAVSVLAFVVFLSMIFLMLMACGYNLISFIGIYCCFGLFGHSDQVALDNTTTPKETAEDGFVKLGDY